jgi:hypothetical protein
MRESLKRHRGKLFQNYFHSGALFILEKTTTRGRLAESYYGKLFQMLESIVNPWTTLLLDWGRSGLRNSINMEAIFIPKQQIAIPQELWQSSFFDYFHFSAHLISHLTI